MPPAPLSRFARFIVPHTPAPAAIRSPAGNTSRTPALSVNGPSRAARVAKLTSNMSADANGSAGVGKVGRPGISPSKAAAPASRFAHWAGRGIVPSVPSPAETGLFATADEAARFILNAGASVRAAQTARAAALRRPLPRSVAPDMDTPEGVAAFVLGAGRNARGQR